MPFVQQSSRRVGVQISTATQSSTLPKGAECLLPPRALAGSPEQPMSRWQCSQGHHPAGVIIG